MFIIPQYDLFTSSCVTDSKKKNHGRVEEEISPPLVFVDHSNDEEDPYYQKARVGTTVFSYFLAHLVFEDHRKKTCEGQRIAVNT